MKSLDSGDNNRDLQMLEVSNVGLYPLMEIKAKTAEIPSDQENKIDKDG